MGPKDFVVYYWNYLVWGSLEIYFLEVGAYESLKRATKVLSEGCFCRLLSENTPIF